MPAWVWWGCGGGCLLAILAAVGLLVLGGTLVRDVFDPDKAWAGVAELLPHDERPEGWEAFGTARFGVGVFVLRPPHSPVFVIVQRTPDAAEIERQLEPETPFGLSWPRRLESLQDFEVGTIELQGRSTRCLRFTGDLTEDGAADGEVARVAGLRIDLTGAGPPTLLHVVLEPGMTGSADERVAELLRPFDLWRGR